MTRGEGRGPDDDADDDREVLDELDWTFDGDEERGDDEHDVDHGFGAGGDTADLDEEEAPEPLSDREESERARLEETDWSSEADRVMDSLMERVGEAQPQNRLKPTRRAGELLGDVHRAYPVVHLTGTNGKSSTARIISGLLGAHGLRVGLFTSPHLERLNERIEIGGEPVSDERLVANWDDIAPFLAIVDAELQAEGEPRLTFFEALTVLAFACFADAPVDVAVLEVGLGGEWDSTNVADGQVAVFTPIGIDHANRLGSTIGEIARTKAGIIKPAARVVSARQAPEAIIELERACEIQEAPFAMEGDGFALTRNDPEGTASRIISVRGLAGTYDDLILPLRGVHQGENAALAIAAVEAFFGGDQELRHDLVEQGLIAARSPGRLQRIGYAPPVFVDAAHNPHGAAALAAAVPEAIEHDRLVVVLGVLNDKDADGIIRALAPIADAFVATQSDSPRAVDAFELADRITELTGHHADAFDRAEEAFEHAREIAGAQEGGAVLVTGSITLLGDAIRLGRDEDWGRVDG